MTTSAGSSSDGAGAAAGEADGETIKIMAIGLFESPALSLPDAQAAMEAKVMAVNAAGGIDGSMIELSVCNDKLDPNQAASCARDAVSKGVVAVVASYEPFTDQVLPILEEAGIPFFNGEGINVRDANSPIEFPLTGGVITAYAALGVALAEDGCMNAGIIAVNAEVVQVGAEWAAKGIASQGGTSEQVDVTLEQVAFDAELAQLESKGAECIVPATNPPQGASIVKTLNGSLPVGGIASEFPQQSLTTLGPLADKVLIADQWYQPWDTDNEQIAMIQDAMAEYTPDTELSEAFGVLGWASMTAALGVIDAAEAKTPAAVLEAAGATSSVDTDGLLGEFGWDEPGPVASMPKFTNWSYLTWTVTDGVPELATSEFVELTGVS